MALTGFSSRDGIGIALFGLLLAAGGGYGIYNFTQVPSDQQIDEWISEDLQGLDKRALDKIGIDKSELMSESAVITGPYDFTIFKVGKDKVLRFGKIAAAIINFTPNQLLVYNCMVDVTTGNTLKEGTDEYFYRDVVSVSTKTKDGQIGAIRVSAGEYFTLTTSGGTSVEVFLQSPEIGKQFGGAMPSTNAEKSIQTIRKMLREKKGATA